MFENRRVSGIAHQKYFYEVQKITQSEKQKYDEVIMEPTKYIYLYKPNTPEVIVRAPNVFKKIHGWQINLVEVLLKKNQNPAVYHWKQIAIHFRGDLILSILPDFNQALCNEICDVIPKQKRPKYLEKWLLEQIDDIFLIEQKCESAFKFEHGYILIQTLYRLRFKSYYEIHSWRDTKWQQLLQIAKEEKKSQRKEERKSQRNDSYDQLFQEIHKLVMEYGILRDNKYKNMYAQYNEIEKKTFEKERRKVVNPISVNKVMAKYHLYELLLPENQGKRSQ